MSFYQRKNPLKNDCGIEKALNVISGKWKPAILSELFKRNLRLKEMEEGLPEASKRSITQKLSEMIADGLIQKRDYNQYPKKTEYSLTELGKGLFTVLNALNEFGERLP